MEEVQKPLRIRRKYIDLVGKKYGRLTVIRLYDRVPFRNKSVEIRWLCSCNCGERVIVKGINLRDGSTRSCGCLQKDSLKKNVKKMPIGAQFGYLIVLKRLGSNKKRNALYLCSCICGRETTVLGTHLRNGNTKSCGCLIKLNAVKHGLSGTKEYRKYLARRTKDLKLLLEDNWTYEMEQLLKKTQTCCVVCGVPENLTVDHVKPLTKGNGLRPGNAIILCKLCNSKKHRLDLEQLPPEDADKIRKAANQFLVDWQEYVSNSVLRRE